MALLLKEKEILEKIIHLPLDKQTEILDILCYLETKEKRKGLKKVKKVRVKTFHLGEIKGSLSRKEIYEDR